MPVLDLQALLRPSEPPTELGGAATYSSISIFAKCN
jgi:hypothetical protein